MAGMNPFDLNRIMATMRARPPGSVGGVNDFSIDFSDPMRAPVRGAPMSELAVEVGPRTPSGYMPPQPQAPAATGVR